MRDGRGRESMLNDEHVEVDLVAAEDAERADDTIVITRTDETARRRPPTWMLIAGTALATLLLVAVAIALTSDDDSDPDETVAASETEEPETTDAPRTTLAASPTTLAAVESNPPPAENETPASTEAPPAAVVPPAPPTPAAFVASVSPASVSATAGTPVPVTLTVQNTGGTAGTYGYDTDGCDPMIVPSADIACTQATRQVEVAANSTTTVSMTIDTKNAAPGTYNVPVGDQVVVVTITA
jgi:hypothetical protein